MHRERSTTIAVAAHSRVLLFVLLITTVAFFRPAAASDDQTVGRPTLKQKQTPGMPLDGDVIALKVKHGMAIFWNRSKPYFKMTVTGDDFAGYGTEAVYYSVDDAFLQVISVDVEAFLPAGREQPPAAILAAHRDWDFRNMKRHLGDASAVHSEAYLIEGGRSVLYWEVVPERKLGTDGASKYLMVTTYHEGAVIGATSVQTAKVSLARAKELVFDAISHLEFSAQPFDVARIQQELMAQQ